MRVFSQKLGLDYSFPADSTNQPYHVASIGKVFTATLLQMLAAKGAFSIKDPIRPFFNFDSSSCMVASFHALIEIENILQRMV